MRHGFGFSGFGFSIGTNNVLGAVAAAPELFPDLNLTHVTDDTDGWAFSNGYPFFGPTGGTGPGISASTALDDDNAALVGDDDAALGAAITEGASYTVAITFSSAAVAKAIIIQLGNLGAQVGFVPAVGVVTHTLVAGPYSAPGTAWYMFPDSGDPGGTYSITKISVKAA